METRTHRSNFWFGLGMIVLGIGLIANSLLGPLFADVIDYPFSQTVRNETLGLEAISLILVAPLALVAGVLAWRGHPASGVVALAPAAYSAYMLVQYVLGPQYTTFQPAVLLHLTLFVLSGALIVGAWRRIDGARLPAASRGWAIVVFALAAFVLSRWAGALSGMTSAAAVPAAATDVTMYWSIFLLDLGIVLPLVISTAVGLLLHQPWATKLLYGVVGWFALVPPSVAAMALVKVWRGDPLADPGDTLVLLIAAVAFAAVAIWLFAPLFRNHRRRLTPEASRHVHAGAGR